MFSQIRQVLLSSVNTQLRIILMFTILRFVQSELMEKSVLVPDGPVFLPLFVLLVWEVSANKRRA